MFSRFFIRSKKPASLFFNFLLIFQLYLGHQRVPPPPVPSNTHTHARTPLVVQHVTLAGSCPGRFLVRLARRAETALLSFSSMFNSTISFCQKAYKPSFSSSNVIDEISKIMFSTH